MKGDGTADLPPGPPLDVIDLVDAACDRFEAAWRGGDSPGIEDFLRGCPPGAVPALLRELLILETELAREPGHPAPIGGYLGRFPDHPAIIIDALGGAGRGSSTTREAPPSGGDLGTIASPAGRPPPVAAPTVPGYEWLGELGRGGMGVVYRARELRLNRVVALKMLPPGVLSLPEQVIRFRTEAATVAKIQHPNVVRIHAVGDHEGMPFIEMEYVGGGSLAARLDGTPWPGVGAARLIGALAEGVEEVHRLGVVHRDIKPANVMVDPSGIPKLGDFGLAKDLDDDSGLTRTDAVMGSPSYMAPEQARGGTREAGPAADVYSLGAVLYELLTGRPPFRGATVLETLHQVKTIDPVPPARLVPGVPRDVETICLHCLAKEPGRRYPSARALADDLGRYLRREPISARPVGPVGRAARWAARNRLAAALMATVAIVLVGGFLGMAILAGLEAAARAKSDRILAEMALDRGIALAEAGRSGRGLLWMSEALRFDPRDLAGLRPTVLANVEGWRRQVPRPLGSVAGIRRVFSDEFSADGRAYAGGDRDGTLSLWDLADLARMDLIPAGGGEIVDLAFDADGRRLASADASGVVRLWDARTGRPVGDPLRHPGQVHGLAFDPSGRSLLAVRGEELLIWDLASPSAAPAIVPCDGVARLEGTAFSPDGAVLVLTEGAQIRRRDGRTGRPLGPAWAPPELPRAVAFAPDGRGFAVGYGVSTRRLGGPSGVQLLDADGRPDGPPLPHDTGVSHLRYRPDGRALLAGEMGGTVRLWALPERRGIGRPIDLDGGIKSLSLSPDGRFALICSTSGNIRLCDTSDARIAGPVFDHPGSPRGVFRPDGRSAAVVGSRTLSVIDLAEIRAPSTSMHRASRDARFLPSGRALVTAGGDSTARLWDPSGGRPLAPPMPHLADVDAVDVRPDGGRIATGGRDRDVRIWGTDGRLVGEPIPQTHWVSALRFGLDGRRIVVGRVDNTTRVFDTADGGPIGPEFGHGGKGGGSEVRSILLLPGGDAALSISNDGTGARIDLADGRQVGATLRLPSGAVTPELSPDGRSLMIVAGQQVHLLDAEAGSRRLDPFGIAILSCAFLDGGRTILTGGADRTARFWDAASGRPKGGAIEHDRPVRWVAVSPSGRTFITMTDAGRARLWDVARRKPIGPTFPAADTNMIGRPAFAPDGRSVVLTGDGTEVWPVPAAEDVGLPRLRRELSASTGLAMDGEGEITRLEAEGRPAGDPRPLGDDGWLGREARLLATRGDWAGALWLLDRLIVARPADGHAHASRGQALSRLGRVPEAGREIAAASRLWGPGEAEAAGAGAAADAIADGRWAEAVAGLDAMPLGHPGDRPLRVERGWARARVGDWSGANADLAAFGHGGHRPLAFSHRRALVALRAGDDRSYQDLCRSMFDPSGPPGTAASAMVAWICAIGRGAVADPDALVRSVGPPVAAHAPREGRRLAALALTASLYRAGRFADSVASFERDALASGDAGAPQGWGFMAMACRRLGRDREARDWLDRLAAGVDARPESPGPEDDFWDGAELRVLRAEAEAVVDGRASGRPTRP